MNEKLMRQNAPHVRRSESVRTMMTDVIIALLPLYLMSFFYYGARALALGFVSALCCSVFSGLSAVVCREKIDFLDLTPVITGLILPLLMPADISYGIVLAADAIAILVVKLPFGGTGNNLFNPAAVGFAAVAICWPQKVFSYPAVLQDLPVFGETSAKTMASPAYSLSLGAIPEADLLDMLMGNMAGPMGATNILVLFACGLFLIVRRAVNWRTPALFLVTYTAMAALFPRIGGSLFDAIGYELFSGMLIFGAFFMLAEPVTSPKRDFAKALYSVTSAVMVFLFRAVGGFEDGFVFALIILNVFAPVFDNLCEGFLHLYRHRRLSSAVLKKDPVWKQAVVRSEPVVRKKEKQVEEPLTSAVSDGEIGTAEVLEEAEPEEVLEETEPEEIFEETEPEEIFEETEPEEVFEEAEPEEVFEEAEPEEVFEETEPEEVFEEAEPEKVFEEAEPEEVFEEAEPEEVFEEAEPEEVFENEPVSISEMVAEEETSGAVLAEEPEKAAKTEKKKERLTFGYIKEAIQAAVGGLIKEKDEAGRPEEVFEEAEPEEVLEETEPEEVFEEAEPEEVFENEPVGISEMVSEIEEAEEKAVITEPEGSDGIGKERKKSGFSFAYFKKAIQAAVSGVEKEQDKGSEDPMIIWDEEKTDSKEEATTR